MAKKRRAHAHAHPALTFFHVSTRIIRIRLHAYTRFFVSFRALLSFRQSRVCARTRSHVQLAEIEHVVKEIFDIPIDLKLKI